MSEREFDVKLRQGLQETAKSVVEQHRRDNQPLIFSENGQVKYVDPFTVPFKGLKAVKLLNC